MERIPSQEMLDSAGESDNKEKDFRNYRGHRNVEPKIILPKQYDNDSSNKKFEARIIVPKQYDKDDSSKKCLCMGGPTVLATVVFVSLCSLAWCVACIVIGAKDQTKCKAQPFLTTWLILHGVLLILLKICGALAQRDRKNGRKVNLGVKLAAGLVALAVIVWLILGNVMVWSIWEPDYAHPWFSYGCDGTVFRVAAAGVISQNILVVLGVIVAVLVYLAGARDN